MRDTALLRVIAAVDKMARVPVDGAMPAADWRLMKKMGTWVTRRVDRYALANDQLANGSVVPEPKALAYPTQVV